MMRIVIADHHTQVLRALATMLRELPDVQLVGATASAPELLTLTEVYAPDVVLFDKNLPGSNVANMVADLHALEPRPFVIVMSTRSEDSGPALNAQADTFVSKSDGTAWLLECLDSYAKRKWTREK